MIVLADLKWNLMNSTHMLLLIDRKGTLVWHSQAMLTHIQISVFAIIYPPPPWWNTRGPFCWLITVFQQVWGSVAQEAEDAPLGSFRLCGWFILPADPLCCWVHCSHWAPLLHHLRFKHNQFFFCRKLKLLYQQKNHNHYNVIKNKSFFLNFCRRLGGILNQATVNQVCSLLHLITVGYGST